MIKKHKITCVCGNKFIYRTRTKRAKGGKLRRQYCADCKSELDKHTGRDYVRALIRCRDRHTCQKCKKRWTPGQRRFDVHHLDGLCGQLSFELDRKADISKLITLCHKCHYSFGEVGAKIKKSKNKNIYKDTDILKSIKGLFTQGNSMKAISRKLSISYPSVRNIVREKILQYAKN